MTNTLLFDIETSDLDADFGNMLAFGYQWYPKGTARVVTLLDVNPTCKACGRVDAVDDAPLLKRAYEVMSQADLTVTWYGREGKGFDQRYVNTRLLDARLPKLPDIPMVDLYLTSRDRLKLSSNRLANIQDFLRLKSKKTPILKRTWRQAQAGDVKSIRYIAHHCKNDILVLREVYDLLKPYVKTHPRVAGWEACRRCGGKVTRQGRAISVTKGERYQFQCQACGGWETRPAGRGDVA